MTTDPYAKAGVDVDAASRLVSRISPLAVATHKKLPHGARVLGGIGGFAGAVALPAGMKKPVLVSATDGVGTKLELAIEYNAADCIGNDVVAMCVNDLLCVGAMPLCFLDYIACGKLNPDFITDVIAGISKACSKSGCALVGGETAEMPGMYDASGFDIAGFAVGVAEQDDLLTPCGAPGDALIALSSSGAHSNGYSLIRKLLRDKPPLAQQRVAEEGNALLIDLLLKPTAIYCKVIEALRNRVKLHGLAHITGGGIKENLDRVLPANVTADIDYANLPMPPLFAVLQQAGDISTADMQRIFNCGIGMIAVVPAQQAECAIETIQAADGSIQAWHIGQLK